MDEKKMFQEEKRRNDRGQSHEKDNPFFLLPTYSQSQYNLNLVFKDFQIIHN